MSWRLLTSIDQLLRLVSANLLTVMSSFRGLSGLSADFLWQVGGGARCSTKLLHPCRSDMRMGGTCSPFFASATGPLRLELLWGPSVQHATLILVDSSLGSSVHILDGEWLLITLNFCSASLLGALRAVNLVPHDTLFEMRSAFISTVFRCRASLQWPQRLSPSFGVQREYMGPARNFDSAGCFTSHCVQNTYRRILDIFWWVTKWNDVTWVYSGMIWWIIWREAGII